MFVPFRVNFLTFSEIILHMKKMLFQTRMYRAKNAPKLTKEEHEKMIDDIMVKEDKNGDGVIQHSEFSGPKMHAEL